MKVFRNSLICMAAASLMLLAGCTTSFTFNVTTGDTVKISYSSDDKQKKASTKNGKFLVLNDDDPIVEVAFDTIENSEKNATILGSSDFKQEKVKFNGKTEIMYIDPEGKDKYGYVVTVIPESNTALFMTAFDKTAGDVMKDITVEVK